MKPANHLTPEQVDHLLQCAKVLSSGAHGSFAALIGDAMRYADEHNLNRLRLAFPDLINLADGE